MGEADFNWNKMPMMGRASQCNRLYQAGRSKYWVKVENPEHPAMSRVIEALV